MRKLAHFISSNHKINYL